MAGPKPLWVTSFSDRILHQSGIPLVQSYLQNENTFDFLLGLEHVNYQQLPLSPLFQHHNVLADDFLKQWLDKNSDIVPIQFGGKSDNACKCPKGPHGPNSKSHKPKCPAAWFNYNAARWFRKIVTLRVALARHKTHTQYSSILWIDADCVFTSSVSSQVIDSWFNGKDAFYLKNKRPVMETGVFGFNLKGNGEALLEKLIARYTSGDFRQEDRWDDSMQLQRVLLNPGVSAVDLAEAVTGNADVVENSALRGYITHDKGRHGRKLGIF
jgi:hypothetical protein